MHQKHTEKRDWLVQKRVVCDVMSAILDSNMVAMLLETFSLLPRASIIKASPDCVMKCFFKISFLAGFLSFAPVTPTQTNSDVSAVSPYGGPSLVLQTFAVAPMESWVLNGSSYRSSAGSV